MAAYLIIYGAIVSARGRLMHIREGEIRPAAVRVPIGTPGCRLRIAMFGWFCGSPPPHINLCAL